MGPVHPGQGPGLFFRSKGSPGLLISRSYGRVMPARFASRLANQRAQPPPSLFSSHSLGAIGSPKVSGTALIQALKALRILE
jgi:hypothetical protein